MSPQRRSIQVSKLWFLCEIVVSRNGLFLVGLSLIATRTVDISLCSGGCDVGIYLITIRMLSRSPGECLHLQKK